MTDAYIDGLTMDDALTILATENCIDERVREEQEMQAIASDMTNRAKHYMRA